MAIERLSVLDLEAVAGLAGDAATAVISVTDPGIRAPLSEGFAGVLRLAFHDVDDDMLAALEREPQLWGMAVTPFEANHARELVAFAEEVARDPRPMTLVVHCHAGISRSSAIAWFLQQCYGGELAWQPFFAPNRRVLRLLAEVSGWSVDDPGFW
jgi:predicted protein tyrosine phosphatase